MLQGAGGGEGKARRARHVPYGHFSTAFSLNLNFSEAAPPAEPVVENSRGIQAPVLIYDSAKFPVCVKFLKPL